jgi:hypothetical protein
MRGGNVATSGLWGVPVAPVDPRSPMGATPILLNAPTNMVHCVIYIANFQQV